MTDLNFRSTVASLLTFPRNINNQLKVRKRIYRYRSLPSCLVKKKNNFRGFLSLCSCGTYQLFSFLIHISDDIDHFQQVKQHRHNYNEILENFLMDQQRKQFQEINAEDEFSDEVSFCDFFQALFIIFSVSRTILTQCASRT